MMMAEIFINLLKDITYTSKIKKKKLKRRPQTSVMIDDKENIIDTS